MTVSLTLHLPADAAQSGTLVLRIGDLAPVQVPITVASGLSAVTLGVPGQTWTPGQSVDAGLVGSLAAGVTEAPALTLPLQGVGLWITGYPATCTPGPDTTITCQPGPVSPTGTVDYGTFTVAVLPAENGQQELTATLPGGQANPVAGPSAAPLAPNDPVDLTGPFGGVQVGAASLWCDTPETARANCRGGLSPTDDPQAVSVPVGATVVAAILTWAATAPAEVSDPDAFDTVTLHVDDVATAIDPQEAVAPAAPDGNLWVRSALVTDELATGGHSVWVEGIDAARQGTTLSPMAGWSLTVIWTDPSADATVQYTDPQFASPCAQSTDPATPHDPCIPSVSTSRGDITEIAPQGAAIIDLTTTIWAADPWADKSIQVGGQDITTPKIAGVRDQPDGFHATGFDLLTNIAAPKDQDVGLRNTTGPVILGFPLGLSDLDQLWVGPTLVLRQPGT